jgi:Putative transposase
VAGILRFHEARPPTDDEMDQLLETIDRRVHRLLAGVACWTISNNRLLDLEGGQVRFTYKDYRAAPPDSSKTMTLAVGEFIPALCSTGCRQRPPRRTIAIESRR